MRGKTITEKTERDEKQRVGFKDETKEYFPGKSKEDYLRKVRLCVMIGLAVVGAAAWFSQIYEIMLTWFALIIVFAVLIIIGRIMEKHEDNTIIYDE